MVIIMLNKLKSAWKSYKYRFVPWIALNLKNRTVRMVENTVSDKVIKDEDLLCQLNLLLRGLATVQLHGCHAEKAHIAALETMNKLFGFHVVRTPSHVGGVGVIVRTSRNIKSVNSKSTEASQELLSIPLNQNDSDNLKFSEGHKVREEKAGINSEYEELYKLGEREVIENEKDKENSEDERRLKAIERKGEGVVKAGQLVGLYPGTLYLPHQPILLQSLANSFVFKCIDGVLVDGNDKRLSKSVFKSCVGRDRVGFFWLADQTWLTPYPINPLNIGQYVNNQSKGHPSNVAYQEVTLSDHQIPLPLRQYLPNLWYSPPQGVPVADVPVRIVALVTTRNIDCGEELFSDYFTVVNN
ncbi:SET domain-containing protein 9-like [Oratosquilla oratoria]|uniref:SET domain-containing protein 9-like n=1 Tax=Oratosquilla oratoria TaxID=337810 RepID=UPI003F776E85